MYKQTQGGCQNEDTKKHGPNERSDQNCRKRTKQNEYKPSDAEFKTLVIRILKKLSEDLNSIKKIQSETKDMLIEIKNNLQGNNSSVMKPRIKSMIWNIKNQKTSSKKTRRKKMQKNEGSIRSLGTTSGVPMFASQGC